MPTTPKSTIINWFKRGLKPLEAQFAAWLDSYWHKSEGIPMASVAGLEDALNSIGGASNMVVDCGGHDASGGLLPVAGGTGPAGAIARGNQFDVTVAGVVGGEVLPVGATIRAKVATPGQVLGSWRIYY